jgi:hypothetical protein
MASKRETQKLSIGKAKASIQRPRPDTVIRKGLAEVLPTSVQKSYFMLSDAERGVLNTALEKYRPGQSEPILVGGKNRLKPALLLMTSYRLVIEEIEEGKVISSYTRWVSWIVSPRNRPILDFAAGTLCAFTVGPKSTSQVSLADRTSTGFRSRLYCGRLTRYVQSAHFEENVDSRRRALRPSRIEASKGQKGCLYR